MSLSNLSQHISLLHCQCILVALGSVLCVYNER